MKLIFVRLLLVITFFIYGCSGGDDAQSTQAGQQVAEQMQEVSQAETMEEIWASSLDPAEKAKRVQELLARQNN
jgi:hypothetical protein